VIADDPFLHHDFDGERWDSDSEARGPAGEAGAVSREVAELRAQLEAMRQQMADVVLNQPVKYADCLFAMASSIASNASVLNLHSRNLNRAKAALFEHCVQFLPVSFVLCIGLRALYGHVQLSRYCQCYSNRIKTSAP
jgi:hypothetical protein